MFSTPSSSAPDLSGSSATLSLPAGAVAGRAAYSRLVQRLRRRYADQLHLLPEGPPTRQTMQTALDALLAQSLATGAALRVLRQIVLERLVVLDCEAFATTPTPLVVITRAMTALAELALDEAMRMTQRELDALYGAPQREGSTQRA